MNNFKKNKYFIKRKVMNLDTINFVKDYLKLRKKTTSLMLQKNFIPPNF